MAGIRSEGVGGNVGSTSSTAEVIAELGPGISGGLGCRGTTMVLGEARDGEGVC